MRRLRADLARAWRRLRSRGLREWLTLERDAIRLVVKTAPAVERGEESVHYNPMARTAAESVARLAEGSTAVEHAATQVRGIARTLRELRVRGIEWSPAAAATLAEYAELLAAVGTARRVRPAADRPGGLPRRHRPHRAGALPRGGGRPPRSSGWPTSPVPRWPPERRHR